MDFLTWLESSALATWVRESGSLWAYPTILTIHTIGLSILVGANAALDLRLLGVAPRIPIGPLDTLFRFMWAGFWLNALSGVALFIGDATVKGTQPVFMVKLGLIALGVVNIGMLRRYLARTARLAPGAASFKGRVLAATSLVIWAGAITAGRLMAYL
jgi:hypothetical protein